MPFELTSKTKARCTDVRTLSKKDRKPDEQPGAQLLLTILLPASSLTMFDGFLAGMLFRKAGATNQGKLEGLEGEELTSIGERVKRLPWDYKQTACSLTIILGLGTKRSNVELDDVTVHRTSFHPQQGGSVKVQLTIDALNVSDEVRGKLTGLKSTEIDILLALPEAQQDDIDTDRSGSGDESKRRLDASGANPFPPH